MICHNIFKLQIIHLLNTLMWVPRESNSRRQWIHSLGVQHPRAAPVRIGKYLLNDTRSSKKVTVSNKKPVPEWFLTHPAYQTSIKKFIYAETFSIVSQFLSAGSRLLIWVESWIAHLSSVMDHDCISALSHGLWLLICTQLYPNQHSVISKSESYVVIKPSWARICPQATDIEHNYCYPA